MLTKNLFILGARVSLLKAGQRSTDESLSGPITEGGGGGGRLETETQTVNTREDRDGPRARETPRQTDPSCSCPAGERIGGIGEAWRGPAIGSMQAL